MSPSRVASWGPDVAEGRKAGFTVLESSISLAIFMLLVGSILSLSVEISKFVGLTDADAVAQLEADRAFARLAEVLRKTGRLEEGGIEYPWVSSDGAILTFRVLEDRDGNGYAFKDGDGDPEWDPRIFEVRLDPDGNLRVFEGSEPVYHLGRYVENLSFRTVREDPTLRLREIAVTFEIRRTGPDGVDLVRSVGGSVHMRN